MSEHDDQPRPRIDPYLGMAASMALAGRYFAPRPRYEDLAKSLPAPKSKAVLKRRAKAKAARKARKGKR